MTPAKSAVASPVSRLVVSWQFLPRDLRSAFLTFGLEAEGRSLLSRRRLTMLYLNCTDPFLPKGSFVECGVARGGGVAMMALAAEGQRQVWGFDSFEGMPPLSAEDKGSGQEYVGQSFSGPDGFAEAQRTLRRFSQQANLVRGWFEDTLPQHVSKLSPIAVLRLDNDWYKSTLFCLDTLYDAVAEGGVVIIDDYYTYTGCREAVDEFRARRRILSPLVTTEADSEVYWKKAK